jgi:hypothetical protein
MAIMDVKYHSVPKAATFIFVLISLIYTTPLNLLSAAVLSMVLYAMGKVMQVGTGDRKIIFGLACQYGLMFGLMLVVSIIASLIVQGIIKQKEGIPLIPVIYAVYITFVVYSVLSSYAGSGILLGIAEAVTV